MTIKDRNYKIVNSCSTCRFLLEDGGFDDMIYGCSYNVWEYSRHIEMRTRAIIFSIDVPKLRTGKTYTNVMAEEVELTGVCDKYEEEI